ncbi:MAG TPA: 5-oxo-L-prolinase, partial [Alcanivorax sp.]|nr:5-oxo-L-prolinase [Alcanivorax sp.]
MRTGLFGALLMVAGLASAGEGGWVDAHLHYVDFMQQSDGSEAMLAAMDEAGVEDAWLFGLPVVKKWQQDAPRRPRYYLGDEAPLYYYSATDDIVAGAVRDLPEDQRRRLAPFISGFNPTDMNAARHVQALIERYPGLWRGIGEVITRHDDLTALTAGETARANHPALMKVYRLAARHDLPVLLHSNLTSLREETPIYLGELEDALRSNPDTRFVLAHAGTSGGVEKRQAPLATLNEIIRALLERYDNLYVDLSWSVREHYLIKDGEPRAAWVALIEDHPDRFVLGSDVVGHFDSIGAILGEYRPLL